MLAPPDFPKLRSLFLRVTRADGCHVVTPNIDPDCAWALEPGVRAIDKLDGTNVCIGIVDGIVCDAYNRTHCRWPLFRTRAAAGVGSAWYAALAEGLAGALSHGWLDKHTPDGWHYGELIGPKINGNRHGRLDHLWVPFDHLRQHYHWWSWISGAYPKTFEGISAWFQNDLYSLFEIKDGNPHRAEGVVFTHPDGRMCKLRRDMFSWFYESKQHA